MTQRFLKSRRTPDSLIALARREAAASAATFVPVHVAGEPECDHDHPRRDEHDGAASMEIVLTDGRRVRLTVPVDGQALAEVLDVLERRPC